MLLELDIKPTVVICLASLSPVLKQQHISLFK